MEINKGFQIDEPKIFVPWNIDEDAFVSLFNNNAIKCITKGYYSGSFLSLNGLDCMIGFHFESKFWGELEEIEFFRTSYSDQQQSFDEFQKYFEQQFGKPTMAVPGDSGFENYEWVIGKVRIAHFVYERYGPEEHMRIKLNRD